MKRSRPPSNRADRNMRQAEERRPGREIVARPPKSNRAEHDQGLTRPVPARHGRLMLYGFHAVAEALVNPTRRSHRLYATDNALRRLEEAGISAGRAEVVRIRPEDLDRLLGRDAVHQGLALECEPLPSPALEDLAAEGMVLVLDQVTDPHNVGAILRTAAAFGVRAVVLTERHSPDATGVLAKTASGGLEHVPIIHVPNLAAALVKLGDLGFHRIGLDSDGPHDLAAVVPPAPVALVLGAEGRGLRRLTRERCDALARLDMPGAIRSLNVSNAAAVALYALSSSR